MRTPHYLGLVLASMAAATAVYGQAIITNGTVGLGVDVHGQLGIFGGPPSTYGTAPYGLRFIPTGYESTAPGCICEGWGAADAGTLVTGYADNAAGIFNLTPVSFTSTASTAKTVSDVGSTLRVTHDFKPSATPNLYEVTVSMENISGGTLSDIRYTRAMDWDVEPTPFYEYSTIVGTATTTALLYSNNNGFEVPDPLGGRSPLTFPDYANVDFIDAGPNDHGAVFDFGFGALAAGDTFSFTIFYGAASTELGALAALGVVGAELYSLGESSVPGGPDLGIPNTFIFAFKGVGGVIVVDPATVPEASTQGAGLALVGLMGASVWRRRQARK